jgi:hypothetical protein
VTLAGSLFNPCNLSTHSTSSRIIEKGQLLQVRNESVSKSTVSAVEKGTANLDSGADQSSKNVMSTALLIASVMGIVTFFIVRYSGSVKSLHWLYPAAFFILGIAHQGVRMGRKTYVIDMATGNDRINYLSISNTLIGIILLLVGSLSALVSLFSVEGVFLFLSLLGLMGAYRSDQLPNVEKRVETNEQSSRSFIQWAEGSIQNRLPDIYTA